MRSGIEQFLNKKLASAEEVQRGAPVEDIDMELDIETTMNRAETMKNACIQFTRGEGSRRGADLSAEQVRRFKVIKDALSSSDSPIGGHFEFVSEAKNLTEFLRDCAELIRIGPADTPAFNVLPMSRGAHVWVRDEPVNTEWIQFSDGRYYEEELGGACLDMDDGFCPSRRMDPEVQVQLSVNRNFAIWKAGRFRGPLFI
jgi:hypothetical protein